jgi:hypothetical protein
MAVSVPRELLLFRGLLREIKSPLRKRESNADLLCKVSLYKLQLAGSMNGGLSADRKE